jgi:hypothetical protein
MELAAPDLRPAIFCEDSENLEFSKWKTPTDAEADCLIYFQGVRRAAIKDFPHEGKLRAFINSEGSDQIEGK